MSKKLEDVETIPITARISVEDVALIDVWRRNSPSIPSRSRFVRLAVMEKLEREGLLHPEKKGPYQTISDSETQGRDFG